MNQQEYKAAVEQLEEGKGKIVLHVGGRTAMNVEELDWALAAQKKEQEAEASRQSVIPTPEDLFQNLSDLQKLVLVTGQMNGLVTERDNLCEANAALETDKADLTARVQCAEAALQVTTSAHETAEAVLADVRRENEALKADKAALEAEKTNLDAQIVALNTKSLPNEANSEPSPSDNSVKSEIPQAAVSAVNDTATTKPTPKPAKE